MQHLMRLIKRFFTIVFGGNNVFVSVALKERLVTSLSPQMAKQHYPEKQVRNDKNNHILCIGRRLPSVSELSAPLECSTNVSWRVLGFCHIFYGKGIVFCYHCLVFACLHCIFCPSLTLISNWRKVV